MHRITFCFVQKGYIVNGILKFGGNLGNLESGGTTLPDLGEPLGAPHVAPPLVVE
jgi:hypothetical protein